MRARIVAALIGLACVSGCASVSPSATPASPGSAEPIPAACPEIDLRSPTGEPVQLTDRWRELEGGTYYLRQSGSCVWITGFSVDTGAPGGEGASEFTNAFFGHLDSDFTFSGVWADMPWGRGTGAGTVTWDIDFNYVDEEQGITLTVTDVTGGVVLHLVRPDADADFRARLTSSEECAGLVSDDGDAYELAHMPPGWAYGEPPRLLGPNDEEILPAASFVVTGEVARGTGECGPGLLLFADSIEASVAP